LSFHVHTFICSFHCQKLDLSVLTMKVFLSWSGTPSKTVAIAFRDLLKRVIQSSEPWVSDRDIQAGRRWRGDLAEELRETNFGIICVTKDNQSAPWILFESGALAKMV